MIALRRIILTRAGQKDPCGSLGVPEERCPSMDSLGALQQLVPELAGLLERRYTLLRMIRSHGPIGRRFIAAQLGGSERVIRGDLDLLREQGLLHATSLGVRLTPEGERVLSQLQDVMRDVYGLEQLERKLAAALGVKKMIIVPGDCDKDPPAKGIWPGQRRSISAECCRMARSWQCQAAPPWPAWRRRLSFTVLKKRVTVVPVRGGLGEDIRIQSIPSR